MYAVIADYVLHGTYKREWQARKALEDLFTYPVNWKQSPKLFFITSANDLPEIYHQSPAYVSVSRRLEDNRTGTCK